MTGDDRKEISDSAAKIKSIFKVIRIVCLAFLVLFAAIWLFMIGLQIFEYVKGTQSDVNVGSILYLILFGILVCILLVITLVIFSDIIIGGTPFSMKLVKRLRIMGTVFAAYAAIDIFYSTAFYFTTDITGQYFGVMGNSGADASFIGIGLAPIFAAFACFGLALIFKYGILLQELSDDTL